MRHRILLILIAIAITAGAIGLRLYAADRLPIDNDEPTYFESALAYNNFMRQGQWTWLAWYYQNYTHPVFYKIVYGLALFTQPPLPQMDKSQFKPHIAMAASAERAWGMVGRYTSVFFGGLAVMVLALLNPLAGIFIAVQTIAVKYTSSFYLESLPFMTSLLAAIFYSQWFSRATADKALTWKEHAWLGLSALALGVTAASKYIYSVVGLAIGVHFLFNLTRDRTLRRYPGYLIAWGGLSLLAFFAFDPYLWPHPIERLVRSIGFQTSYATSATIIKSDLPVWQPLIWLSNSYPNFIPEMKSGFIIAIDPLISLLAVAGLPRLWKRQPLYLFWLVIGITVLVAWPVKWPQYEMAIIVPLCLSAAEGAAWLLSFPWHWIRRRGFAAPA
jgi:hypothetical protein